MEPGKPEEVPRVTGKCQKLEGTALGLIPGSERSPGGRHGNPLQHSCPENPHGQRSLAGYSPWGHKESDTTQRSPAQRQGRVLRFRLQGEQDPANTLVGNLESPEQ